MDGKLLGLLVGGLLPAIFYGFTNISAKFSTNAGIGIAPYLIVIGLTVTVVGCGFSLWDGDLTFSRQAGLYAMCVGSFWALGTGLVAIALNRYGTPISVLSSIFNANTLIAATLGLWIFAEWQTVSLPRISIGALLIVIGSVFVSISHR
ncbi:MAG: hypothetical protein AAGG02_09600 [Cyanobacteria bacterium P01_H01_bin.15]